MKPLLKLLFATLSMFMISWSCNKTQAPPCRGNCAPMTATGVVMNTATGMPAAGATVTLCWYRRQSLIGYEETIATVTSSTDGSFNITANIDTSYFDQRFFLWVKAENNKDYIIISDHTRDYTSFNYDPAWFQNRQLNVCRKANLKIRWHKKYNNSYSAFEVSYAHVLENIYRTTYNNAIPASGEATVETAADVYTKILVAKTLANGSSSTIIDSIKCPAGTTSIYDIDF